MDNKQLLQCYKQLESLFAETKDQLVELLREMEIGRLPRQYSLPSLPLLNEARDKLVVYGSARPDLPEMQESDLDGIKKWVDAVIASDQRMNEIIRLIRSAKLSTHPEPEWWLNLIESSIKALNERTANPWEAERAADFWYAVYQLSDLNNPIYSDDFLLDEHRDKVSQYSRDVERALFRKKIHFEHSVVLKENSSPPDSPTVEQIRSNRQASLKQPPAPPSRNKSTRKASEFAPKEKISRELLVLKQAQSSIDPFELLENTLKQSSKINRYPIQNPNRFKLNPVTWEFSSSGPSRTVEYTSKNNENEKSIKEMLFEDQSAATSNETILPAEVQKNVQNPYEKNTESANTDKPIQKDAAIQGNVLESVVLEQPQQLHEQIWELLSGGHKQAAYRLAEFVETHEKAEEYGVPLASLLKSSIIGTRVRNATGELSRALRTELNDHVSSLLSGIQQNTALRLLLASATIAPTLFAPTTNAPTLLQGLHFNGLERLESLRDKIFRFSAENMGLSSFAISQFHSAFSWEEELVKLRREVQAWMQQASIATTCFLPATEVWRYWVKEQNGAIQLILAPILEERHDIDIELQSFVERFSDYQGFTLEVDRTDSQVLGRTRGSSIRSKAMMQLRNKADNAIQFYNHWHELASRRSSGANSYKQRQIDDLRSNLDTLLLSASQEIADYSSTQNSDQVKIACELLIDALKGLHQLIRGEGKQQIIEPSLRDVLNSTLTLTDVALDSDTWEPLVPIRREHIDQMVERRDWTHDQLFMHFKGIRDLGAARRVLEAQHVLSAPISMESLDEVLQNLQENLYYERDAVRRGVEDTTKQIEKGYVFTWITENQRLELIDKIESMSLTIDNMERFSEAHETMDNIRYLLAASKTEKVRQFLEVLADEGIGADHPLYPQFHNVLENGDIPTADEYLIYVREGKSFPEHEERINYFTDFFDEKYEALQKFAEERGRRASVIIEDVKNQRSLGPITLSQVARPQLIGAASMMSAWYSMKDKRATNNQTASFVKTIMEQLGFNVKSVNVNTLHTSSFFEVECQPITDSLRIPLSAYGSGANGKYRIFCFWDRETSDNILDSIGHTRGQTATIAFHFGRMTTLKAREFSRKSRERRRTVALIDELLMFYLCGVRNDRMPVLFQCVLPFTYIEPYTSQAGLVTPEMFFGRKRELQLILNAQAGFIYGGRQLGKTALLREAERQFHNPPSGHYAFWIDLQGSDMTDIDHIWSVIGERLASAGILPKKTKWNAKLLTELQTWLEADNQRRILLLLDESDRFLELDGRDFYTSGSSSNKEDRDRVGFYRCRLLKNLMDVTRRRFHVVFTGLHNVQRTTRNENNPLAHFGVSLCIGPLHAEWDTAKDLVKLPMELGGYLFESEDLVTRILSQTNYYPSLIQLYCKQLLHHMLDRPGQNFDLRKCPPFKLTARHIEQVYHDKDLKREFAQRISWTLQLDDRYEVIAYSIAFESLDNRRAFNEGFRVAQLREMATVWWPEGLAELNTDDFRILLGEMVGLGILRETSSGGFTLRSLSLVSLMGSEEMIEEKLMRSRSKAPVYEPSLYRPIIGDSDNENPYRRSILTVQQGELLRNSFISVIYGTEASGIGEIRDCLPKQGQSVPASLVIGEETNNVRAFEKKLQQIARNGKDTPTYVIISQHGYWTEAWIECTLSLFSKNKEWQKSLRVIFICDSNQTWLLEKDEQAIELLDGVTQLSLSPWHDSMVRYWIDEQNLDMVSDINIKKLRDVTGYWPRQLYLYRDLKIAEKHGTFQTMEENFFNAAWVSETLSLFDIRKECKLLLQVLALDGKATILQLSGEDLTKEQVKRSMRWAEKLGIVKLNGKDSWSMDPFVRRLINAEESYS